VNFENIKNKFAPKLFAVLIWMFPVLFLIDNILGFNGYQFTIGGKSIRIILFCITVAELFAYCLLVMIKEKISFLPKKTQQLTIWKLLRPLDYLVLFFIVANGIWATAVPLMVRGEMIYSLKDFSTILVLVLYFPIAFLVRMGRLSFSILEKAAYILITILALWHCIMYVGETVSPGFYEGYFDLIDKISMGTAVRSEIVAGFGIVRIIQTTSMFLLIGIFLAIKRLVRGKWWHIIPLFILTFAICVTYTKSIWFGYLAGLFIYLAPCIVTKKYNKNRIRSAVALVIALAMIFVLNFAVFNNTIFERAFNTVRSGQSIDSLQQMYDELAAAGEDVSEIENKLKDALGTQAANSLRSAQNSALLEKWSQSKFVGFGYGSYAEDCIRSEKFPYMYESTLPALVMKIGLIGCAMWVVFICGATVVAACTFRKEKRENLFMWLGIAISYAMAVQTNPFLFTFAGISILLYLLISVQEKYDFLEEKE